MLEPAGYILDHDRVIDIVGISHSCTKSLVVVLPKYAIDNINFLVIDVECHL